MNLKMDSNIITKFVDLSELEITLLASENDICPRVLSSTKMDTEGVFTCEKYPCNLVQYKRSGKVITQDIKDKVFELIARLHNLGIVHCDMKLDNIVIDHKDNVRLIDFGMSMYKKNVCTKTLKELNMSHFGLLHSDSHPTKINEKLHTLEDVEAFDYGINWAMYYESDSENSSEDE